MIKCVKKGQMSCKTFGPFLNIYTFSTTSLFTHLESQTLQGSLTNKRREKQNEKSRRR